MLRTDAECVEKDLTIVTSSFEVSDLDVRVWGARGSMPASGAKFDAFGGETSCVELRVPLEDGTERVIVIDAGSGILALGKILEDEGVREIDLVFSHLHYDHIMGFPFFAPVHNPDVRLRIHYGGNEHAPSTNEALEASLQDYLRQPFFPVGMDCFRADISTHVLPSEGLALDGVPNLSIEHRALCHPGGATGYRFEHNGSVFAYITDFEHDGSSFDENVLFLARNADLALMDATFTPEDYLPCAGWGHANWKACGELAMRAGTKNWGLFHHQHERTDDEIRLIEREARRLFPNAFAARVGQRFALANGVRQHAV